MAEETEQEKYKIPLFDGSNYENWKFRMGCLLDEKDLLKYVEERPVYEQVTAEESHSEHVVREERNA